MVVSSMEVSLIIENDLDSGTPINEVNWLLCKAVHFTIFLGMDLIELR